MLLERKYTGLPEGVHLNEMQELVVPYMGSTDNLLVASPTASGKSTVINMVGQKYLEDGGNIIYVGSAKALVEEKRGDWNDPNHPWYKLPKTVITGDYAKTKDKQGEIDIARLIVITPESLASYLRKLNTEAGHWLYQTGLIVIDEIHLVGQKGRGGNLEAAMMEFCHEFPNAQILGLSATLPNVSDVTKWLTALNKKPTNLVYSTYRPVPLKYHYIPYYSDYERSDIIRNLVAERHDQQFLVGVFNKNFGNEVMNDLKEDKVTVDFHNSNQSKPIKDRMELAFKQGSLRVLVGTSGVFTGVNYPARCVVITATRNRHTVFDTFELQQLAGRAGRPRYDSEGDVFVLVEPDYYEYDKNRIENGENIFSQLIDPDTCATHFLGAIYLNRISTREDFLDWYKTSLAYAQNTFTSSQMNSILNGMIVSMVKYGMITIEHHNEIRLTKRGTVCAQMLFNPVDLFGYCVNFYKLFSMEKPNDIDFINAIAAVQSNRSFSSNKEKRFIPTPIQDSMDQSYWKAGAVLYYKMNGKAIPYDLMNVHFQIMSDFDRVEQVLIRVSQESEGWGRKELISQLCSRIREGISWNDAKLRVNNYKKSDIKRFQQMGLNSYEQVVANKNYIAKQN